MEHKAVITKKPVLTGVQSAPDGAVCGNGDLGVILGNSPCGLRIFLSKSDLWYFCENHDRGGLRPLGIIDLPVNKSDYDNYYVEEDFDNRRLFCRFGKTEFYIAVCGTENAVLIYSENGILPDITLGVNPDASDGNYGVFSEGEIKGIYREFDDEFCGFSTFAYAAAKRIGGSCHYIAAATNHDVSDPKAHVVKCAEVADEAYIESLKAAHAEKWKEFLSKSSFTCSDDFLENRWYASLYFIAGMAGNRSFPPGLYGNFITVEKPNWKSDYHLNYNYQAPFYGVCSSNHPELTDCYQAPLEEFMPRGRDFAARFGCGGILLPVGIVPKGLLTELQPQKKLWFKRLFLGQKSNAIHPADIMVFRWKTTRDLDYARNHAYPYIKEAVAFFEDYRIEENGQWVIPDDSAHEVPYYIDGFREEDYPFIHDKNNVVTLGLLRMCLDALLDMSASLGVDEDKRPVWRDFLERLAPFPVYRRYGKKVFRYTSSGQAWDRSNDVGIQHIYPCGAIDINSPSDLLNIARATVNQRPQSWLNGNALCSFGIAAARIGIAPKKIIRMYKKVCQKYEMPNLLINQGGGLTEDCSIFTNLLNEMVLQSNHGIITLFPDWDRDTDCEFKTLRAEGAFLVSSSVKNGIIGETAVYSEKGTALVMKNPFVSSLVVTSRGEKTVSDEYIRLETSPGETIKVIRHGDA